MNLTMIQKFWRKLNSKSEKYMENIYKILFEKNGQFVTLDNYPFKRTRKFPLHGKAVEINDRVAFGGFL